MDCLWFGRLKSIECFVGGHGSTDRGAVGDTGGLAVDWGDLPEGSGGRVQSIGLEVWIKIRL